MLTGRKHTKIVRSRNGYLNREIPDKSGSLGRYVNGKIESIRFLLIEAISKENTFITYSFFTLCRDQEKSRATITLFSMVFFTETEN